MREHNFTAGPAVLPHSVIKELQEALPNFKNNGLGLMELSHRSPIFDEIISTARLRLRRLLSVPDDYEVLFLQGGASLQFYMTALNLLSPTDCGDYINTGTWSTKAIKEAKRCSKPVCIWSPSRAEFNSTPTENDYQLTPESHFLHYTSNNTIYGTQFSSTPEVNKPLIGDMSSDICSRAVDVSKHGVIYAGAQKNLGPSGVTVVLLSPWAVERSRYIDSIRPGGLPSLLNYSLMVDKGSLFNTPNTFGIFALERMLAWLEGLGGVSEIEKQNTKKSTMLYQILDNSDFWKPYAERRSRSQMNVTWKITDPSLESVFVEEASAAGLHGLKGHRSVGGLRASIYNACPLESVEALVDFMHQFETKNS